MTTSFPSVRLLASVTSESEARLAARHGADVIDCKDPVSGALGALPAETVAAIRRAVPAEVPVSATIGDLPLDPDVVVPAARAMAATGVDIVKVGLFAGGDATETVRRLGSEIEAPLVAVLMADAPLDLAIVDELGQAGFAGVMLDTAAKDGSTLLDHRKAEELADFIARARAASLFSGLAGSLRLQQIPDLLSLAPDILGFRGALCRERDHKSALEARALAAVRAAIPHQGTAIATERRSAVLEWAS